MHLALLIALQLAFSMLLAAAGAAYSARSSKRALGLSLLVAAVALPGAFHGLLVWKALSLRFELGVEHAPWPAALGLFLAHAAVLPWVLTVARRRALSPVPLASAAALALALACGLYWNLELRARVILLSARVEAGRIAYRVAPGRVDPAENAAPLYEEHVAELFEGPAALHPGPWRDVLRGEAELTADDPELRALLDRAGPALARARETSRLPRCSFETGAGGDYEVVRIPSVLPLYSLAEVLALEARVRAQDGGAADALEDVEAIYRIAEHLAQTPLPTLLMTAGAVRELGDRTLVHILSAPELDAGDLSAFVLHRASSLVESAPDMIALEEAYGLGMISSMADAGPLEPYFVLRAEAELAGYRATMAELADRARRLGDAKDAEPGRAPATRGLLAGLLAPKASLLPALVRSDAQGELVRAALAAAHVRSARGTWPRGTDELGVGFERVLLEGDGAFVRITLAEPGTLEPAPELRLPEERSP